MKYLTSLFAGVTFCITTAIVYALSGDPLLAAAYGAVTGLTAGGVATLFKRWLATSEMIKEDINERSVEVNRTIFWKRIFSFTAMIAAYFVGMDIFLQVPPDQ